MSSQLSWLSPHDLKFPDTQLALTEPNGLLAAGGDLSVARLIEAYRRGIFPWYSEEHDPILWWTPDPRMVLFPEEVNISKSLKKQLKKDTFTYSFDRDFEQVMRNCQAPRYIKQELETGTWINEDMLDAYAQLHQEGIAHSIEVWNNDELVGGLYGIAIGQVFYGESMFTKQSNASKCALVVLCQHLASWGYTIIDCQVYSEHLASLGAQEISRKAFEEYLLPENSQIDQKIVTDLKNNHWKYNSLLLDTCLKK